MSVRTGLPRWIFILLHSVLVSYSFCSPSTHQDQQQQQQSDNLSTKDHQSTINNNSSNKSNPILSPSIRPRLSKDSGQIVRLRGDNRSLGEGRVEVRYRKKWGLVCDDFFDINDAHVICRQLGFQRGAESVRLRSAYNNTKLKDVLVDDLDCVGTESSILQCKKASRVDCNAVTEAAGVVSSHCEAGGVLFNDICYYFYNETRFDIQGARNKCESISGSLVTVQNQETSNFLSEVLFAKFVANATWYTSGVKVDNRWKWEVPGGVPSSSFSKWINLRRQKGKKEESEKNKCLLLGIDSTSGRTRNYYFWIPGNCTAERPFICQAPMKDIGCVDGAKEEKYMGKANVTQLGFPCIKWNRKDVLRRGKVFEGQDKWDHNYCRNPEGNSVWCMVSDHEFDLCDIPSCIAAKDGRLCKADEIQCGRMEKCVSKEFLCDYDADCPNGYDENNCTDWLGRFKVTIDRKLVDKVAEVWTYIPHAQGCAKRCAESKNFVCLSFSYVHEDNTCLLSAGMHGEGASLLKVPRVDYYEKKTGTSKEKKQCTKNEMTCENGLCIDKSLKCNSRNDCGDHSDEKNCSNFHVRLRGSSDAWRGRVEVRAFGQWGLVCDDSWDINDAQVVCRQLGFSGAVKAMVGNSKRGTDKMKYLMDDVRCNGQESSLELCPFGSESSTTSKGWGVHDCSKGEVAGVVCSTGKSECTEQQLRCEKGGCINLSWVCDGDKDCQDGSDEDPSKCKQKLEVRLVGGSDENSGRVEIKRFGIWGTVCDDGFDEYDAQVICRMLGHKKGRFFPRSGGTYPAGSGPIWLDELGCNGKEEGIHDCNVGRRWGLHDCRHSEDVGVTCIPHRKGDQTSTVPNSGECGRRFVHSAARDPRKPLLARVVGGFEAKKGAYPYNWDPFEMRQNGSDMITVGRVRFEYGLTDITAGLPDEKNLSLYEVWVGDWDNLSNDGSEQIFQIEKIIVYPEYENVLEHDIVIIKVKARRNGEGIEFSDYVQPICLPPPDTPYRDGMKCTVSGWGSVGIHYPRRLQAASLPILSRGKCAHPSIYSKILSRTAFCAGFLRGGIDSCQGDSGGPFACQLNGKFYLLGVISWGDGCAERDKPGIYTKIVDYLSWIHQHVKT